MTMFQGVPTIQDPQFAMDLAAELKKQADALRASPDAGMETIRYSVRRGGIAGFFGGTRTVSEQRLKPGAQQLLANAAQLDQMAQFYTGLGTTLSQMDERQRALEAAATEEERAALGIQRPVSEGGQQYTRNELARPTNERLAILLGYDGRENNPVGISINPGGTLGGLRIPYGT